MNIESKRLKESDYAKEVCLYLYREYQLKAVVPGVDHFISIGLDSKKCHVSMITTWKEYNSLANGLGGYAAKALRISQGTDLLFNTIDCSENLNDFPKLLFCSSEIIEGII